MILIIEDEPKLAALMTDYLRAARYETEWLSDGTDAVQRIRETTPELVLLDLMLPGKDGLQICREVRGFSEVPIVMVTARVEEIDRLLGLELGADDYVCKPFSPRELVARIKTILRRVQRAGGVPDSALVIDSTAYTATLRGQRLDLTPVEFRLLSALAAAPGRILSRASLLEQIYDDHRIVTDRTVDTHVKNLRRKMEQASPGTDLIHSVYGVGYRLDA
ncbi:response regulator [Ralstonia mannitolilytica]|uniref:Transcriptional regulatory protein BaeR n=1 Tax=Ralstonia mannitolilytica TaxID=105219 RepID=A0AAD2ELV0_9RALS|nr:response regulator [Ralstonia mannitolilytica]MBY4718587.1 response regulator [Ralstonia mannitolilytica]CAJ0694325.1 Transcriptional regulatory protein BaeR [Ralstonia mannitolilytica]CAJ0889257.1 Transcriptional regulatory protein BaeR [Ralstonia mannitolilytica]